MDIHDKQTPPSDEAVLEALHEYMGLVKDGLDYKAAQDRLYGLLEDYEGRFGCDIEPDYEELWRDRND